MGYFWEMKTSSFFSADATTKHSRNAIRSLKILMGRSCSAIKKKPHFSWKLIEKDLELVSTLKCTLTYMAFFNLWNIWMA
jgi:hypothetical protein